MQLTEQNLFSLRSVAGRKSFLILYLLVFICCVSVYSLCDHLLIRIKWNLSISLSWIFYTTFVVRPTRKVRIETSFHFIILVIIIIICTRIFNEIKFDMFHETRWKWMWRKETMGPSWVVFSNIHFINHVYSLHKYSSCQNYFQSLKFPLNYYH